MDGLSAAALSFAMVGVVALVKIEKLVKTLKENGIIDNDYNDS